MAPRKWRLRTNTAGRLTLAQCSAAGRVLPGWAPHPRRCFPIEKPHLGLLPPPLPLSSSLPPFAVPHHTAQVTLQPLSTPQPGPRAGPVHGTLTGQRHTGPGHPSPRPHTAVPSPSRSFHPPVLWGTALLYLGAPAVGDLGGHGSAGCRDGCWHRAGTQLAPLCPHSLCPKMTNFSASPLPAQHKTDTCEDDHYFPT